MSQDSQVFSESFDTHPDYCIMTDIITKYSGVSRIERLALIVKKCPELAPIAAFKALAFLKKDQMVSHHKGLFTDATLMDELESKGYPVSEYRSNSWYDTISNTIQNNLKHYDQKTNLHITKFDVAKISNYSGNYIRAQSVLSENQKLFFMQAQRKLESMLLQGAPHNLYLQQNKSIESRLTQITSSEGLQKGLTFDEIKAYWRSKLLLLLALFLNHKYSAASEGIYKFVEDPALEPCDQAGKISGMDVLNDHNLDGFVDKEEIILVAVISIFLAKSPAEHLQVLNEDRFKILVGERFKYYEPIFFHSNEADFKRVFEELRKYDRQTKYDLFLYENWPLCQRNVRNLAYGLYLSSVTRVSGDHLCRKLDLSKGLLIEEMIAYIFDNNLHFRYDKTTDIFETCVKDERSTCYEKMALLVNDLHDLEKDLIPKVQNLNAKIEHNHPSAN